MAIRNLWHRAVTFRALVLTTACTGLGLTVVKDIYRSNLDKLQKQIVQKGGRVKIIIYPGVDHVGIVSALSWYNPSGAPVLRDITTFFRQP